MRNTLKLALLAATAGVLLPLLASAEGEVYRWKDANGNWHYSDQPQPGAELVKSAKRPPSASAATPARSTAAAPTPAGAAGTLPAPAVSDAVAQQVRAEAAAAREDQCKKATENYDKTVQARRMYKIDDQGNRSFLNDAEIDQARLNARSAKDLACGPQ